MKNFKFLTMAFMVVTVCSTTISASAQRAEVKERRQRTYDAEQIKENRLEKLKAELNLTEQQEAEVKALMDERQLEMEKNRAEREAAMQNMRAKRIEKAKAAREKQALHNEKMKDILSPEQYEKYAQLNTRQREEMKERRSQRMETRRERIKKEPSVQE